MESKADKDRACAQQEHGKRWHTVFHIHVLAADSIPALKTASADLTAYFWLY